MRNEKAVCRLPPTNGFHAMKHRRKVLSQGATREQEKNAISTKKRKHTIQICANTMLVVVEKQAKNCQFTRFSPNKTHVLSLVESRKMKIIEKISIQARKNRLLFVCRK